jgi:hypothetical protein
MGIEYIYTTRIGVSSIKSDAKYIRRASGPPRRPRYPTPAVNFPAPMRKHYTPFLKVLAHCTLHDDRCFAHLF